MGRKPHTTNVGSHRPSSVACGDSFPQGKPDRCGGDGGRDELGVRSEELGVAVCRFAAGFERVTTVSGGRRTGNDERHHGATRALAFPWQGKVARSAG